ncbi:MAG: ATP-binding cassette domain-containing protein [Candidatus Sericytochromatia bacterium]|nr:ATP-binding cassette domain-containing protein [Candidatus Sericytochromatia bacterium]
MITVKNLTKTFEGNVTAVNLISFELLEGETLCMIGTSGCGKTTTLKMLNRLLEPTSGEIFILGKNILEQDQIEVRRKIGYVIQGGGLFPHWTVAKNIGLVPSLQNWDKEKMSARVDELLNLVELEPAKFKNRYPAELSGGQQQRVGIARAMASDPPVILLDEPFSALDPITRAQMQTEFIRLKKIVKKTMVFVTHDLKEAFHLSDKILVMDKGNMQQFGSPDDLKNNPANDFVKNFLESHLN